MGLELCESTQVAAFSLTNSSAEINYSYFHLHLIPAPPQLSEVKLFAQGPMAAQSWGINPDLTPKGHAVSTRLCGFPSLTYRRAERTETHRGGSKSSLQRI